MDDYTLPFFRLPYGVGLGSLKPLQNLQPMEHQRLANIFPINKIMLNHIWRRAVAAPF